MEQAYHEGAGMMHDLQQEVMSDFAEPVRYPAWGEMLQEREKLQAELATLQAAVQQLLGSSCWLYVGWQCLESGCCQKGRIYWTRKEDEQGRSPICGCCNSRTVYVATVEFVQGSMDALAALVRKD